MRCLNLFEHEYYIHPIYACLNIIKHNLIGNKSSTSVKVYYIQGTFMTDLHTLNNILITGF